MREGLEGSVRRPRFYLAPHANAKLNSVSAAHLHTPPSDCDRMNDGADEVEGELLDREHISGVARREIDGGN